MNTPPPDLDALRETLRTWVAPWVAELDLRLHEARLGEVVLTLTVAPKHVHGGGVPCALV